MKDKLLINGFSKFSKQDRIRFLAERHRLSQDLVQVLAAFEPADDSFRKIIEELSENTVSSYHMPFSVAPNFIVNGSYRTFPLVTEESSVVAALAKAAGFWAQHGGFHAEVLGTERKGQLHFRWNGNPDRLTAAFPQIRVRLLEEARTITANMERRGGGITGMELCMLPHILPDYYQIDVRFETLDAMGANFINSCLEQFGRSLRTYISNNDHFAPDEKHVEIVMAILSNYTPDSRVRAWVQCPAELLTVSDAAGEQENYAGRFVQAVRIAAGDVSRAVTHNKGIFNGIDALAMATGNDFRAIEACGHAWACRNGSYASLSEARLENGQFYFGLEIPLAVGVVGGITAVHPLARLALYLLGNPSASQLMMYLATAGLASNFSAVKALVTSGIQKGHMRMHLSNILNQLQVQGSLREQAALFFADKTVSFSEVEKFIRTHRDA